MDLEDLEVYQKLSRLHIEICDLSHRWPNEEKYEIGSQIRRSSNSSPAQLAEKNDDGHVRNKIEGVNRSRVRSQRPYTTCSWPGRKVTSRVESYGVFSRQVQECIRMLDGLEKTLETKLPEGEAAVGSQRPSGGL